MVMDTMVQSLRRSRYNVSLTKMGLDIKVFHHGVEADRGEENPFNL